MNMKAVSSLMSYMWVLSQLSMNLVLGRPAPELDNNTIQCDVESHYRLMEEFDKLIQKPQPIAVMLNRLYAMESLSLQEKAEELRMVIVGVLQTMEWSTGCQEEFDDVYAAKGVELLDAIMMALYGDSRKAEANEHAARSKRSLEAHTALVNVFKKLQENVVKHQQNKS